MWSPPAVYPFTVVVRGPDLLLCQSSDLKLYPDCYSLWQEATSCKWLHCLLSVYRMYWFCRRHAYRQCSFKCYYRDYIHSTCTQALCACTCAPHPCSYLVTHPTHTCVFTRELEALFLVTLSTMWSTSTTVQSVCPLTSLHFVCLKHPWYSSDHLWIVLYAFSGY